ncbi:MAG TPA: hypothetical protein VFT29_02265, partial [Gemmatimonadaceae bacterium]|nr:hypothetical protein [Gemmatimonadaceae bacterium]
LMVTIGSDLKVIPVDFASWRVYGLGGVNYHVFRGIATVSKPGTGACTVDGRGGCYQPTNGSDWKSKPGFHFGAGTDFRVASQEMFLEARVTALQANGARTWMVPISFGLRFF